MQSDTSSEASPPRGADIRTFLFADVRGYARYTHEHGDEAAGALAARFADIVRDAVPGFEGELLEVRGDEALCVFTSARQALRAAVELQRWFRKRVDGKPVLPVGVGMGLDAGEAVPTQGGYRGGALNVAARLCSLAAPGQVLATETVLGLARRVEGLRCEPRKAIRVKGVGDPVRLVEVVSEVPLPPVPVPPLSSRSSAPLRGRRSLVALAAVLAVAAGAVVGVLRERGGATSSLAIHHDGLVFVTQDGGARTVGPVGAAPSAVAVGGGWVWVANRDAGTVTRLSVDTRRIGGTISVGTAPTAIAYDRRSGVIWVTDGASGRVDRVDPGVGRVVKPIRTGDGPDGVAVAAGRVWVANSLDATVSEIDPATDRVVRRIPVGIDPTAIVSAGGDVWVANTTSDTIGRIDARTGDPLPPVPVGDGPDALAVRGGSVWVANGDAGTVSRISIAEDRVTDTFSAGLEPRAIAVTGRTVWVGDARGSLVGVDPSAPTRRIRAALTGVPVALAGAPNGIWAAAEPPLAGHRGGTLRAVEEFSPSDPVDPAISFTPLGVQALTITNDGLTAFRKVSGLQGETVVADLARSIPQPSDNGRTYTFQLRRGLRYSTGRPVRAADFRWALERTFDAGVGAGLYADIDGASACQPRPPPAGCDLGQGIRIDDSAGTVTFHLVHADPDFPAKLALWFADAVPANVPRPPYCSRQACGYRNQPPPVPATGPYMIVPAKLGFNARHGELTLTRNPRFHQWSADAQPSGYPDQIVVHFGQSPAREATEVAQGTADWSPDGAPPGVLAHLLTAIPDQVHRNTTLADFALTLNTRVPPFTKALARRAVNDAINRSLLTRIAAGSTGAPTCQVLPPGMLGYVPYCPYTRRVAVTTPPGSWLAPDLARARSLVRQSGTEGARVTFSLEPTGLNSPSPTRSDSIRFGNAVVFELNSIGYHAHLRVLGPKTPIAPVGAQMATMWWFDDYPAPSDILQLFFSCSHTPTPLIPTRFCNHRLDRQMAHAVRLQASDVTAAAARWRQIDREMTRQAPWVALFTPSNTDIVSERVGNYQYNPQSWVLIDQMWVK